MPRKSSADLHVVRLPGRGRPEPPEQLDISERRAWQAIVDASPDGFINGAGQIILRQTVTQIAIAERHAQRLRKMAEAGVEDLEAEKALSRAHADATRNTLAGLTALRATPHSRLSTRDTGRSFARSPSGRRPWDIRAPTLDAKASADDGDETT